MSILTDVFSPCWYDLLKHVAYARTRVSVAIPPWQKPIAAASLAVGLAFALPIALAHSEGYSSQYDFGTTASEQEIAAVAIAIPADGDPALADVALIPRALKHDDPDWWMQTGELAYEANYQLINDNLLDLAHLSYVHENTLGRNSMSWAESRPTVTPIPRGLRIARWVVNNPGPRYLTMPGGVSHVDMWASYDYMVSGIFLLGTRSYPVGMAAECGMQAPDPDVEPLTTTTTSQAVTPIDERHTIYYYSGCLPRRLASEEDSRQQLALFERAFAEDNVIVEAQQRVIARTPQPRMLWIRADQALNQFRRLLDELMADEAREAAANTVPAPLGAAG